MSRLQRCFDELRERDGHALITYVTAGDPNVQCTVGLLEALAGAGVDVLEVGVPFSDPTADGPVVQAAHERAIASGTRLTDVLHMVGEFRRRDGATPIVLMGYLNPIVAMGETAFADAAAAAGIDGLIAVDLPPEEAESLHRLLAERGIDLIFLIAPTTTDERISRIAALASGFIYHVSVKGTTGAGRPDVATVTDQVAAIRAHTDLPVAVGFGVRDGASAAAIARVADGVVVGSALIDRIEAAENDTERTRAAGEFAGELREALNSTGTAQAESKLGTK